jgi:hypothetical protein
MLILENRELEEEFTVDLLRPMKAGVDTDVEPKHTYHT